jgi:hypothetical protein
LKSEIKIREDISEDKLVKQEGENLKIEPITPVQHIDDIPKDGEEEDEEEEEEEEESEDDEQ